MKRQKNDFDRHNQVHLLPDIPDNTDVWIMMAHEDRQYLLVKPQGRTLWGHLLQLLDEIVTI